MSTPPLSSVRQALAVRDKLREALPAEELGAGVDEQLVGDFAVTKTDAEHRYTFGVMYVPNALDSDDEYATEEDLQKAVWDYVRSGYRGIRDTHTDIEIGELVEIVAWPYPTEVEAKTGDGQVFKYKLPAGTVYSGVIWGEEAWPLVKSGKLRGYSMGGKAIRMRNAPDAAALPRMAELIAAEPATKDGAPIPNQPGKTNWVEETGGLPRYIRQIAEDLVPKHGVSGAIRLAVGIVKRWCRGEGNVTAKTRAKACKAVAQWEKQRAKAHAKTADDVTIEELTKAEGELSAQTLADWLSDDVEFTYDEVE